jgi:hypothetical protein
MFCYLIKLWKVRFHASVNTITKNKVSLLLHNPIHIVLIFSLAHSGSLSPSLSLSLSLSLCVSLSIHLSICLSFDVRKMFIAILQFFAIHNYDIE